MSLFARSPRLRSVIAAWAVQVPAQASQALLERLWGVRWLPGCPQSLKAVHGRDRPVAHSIGPERMRAPCVALDPVGGDRGREGAHRRHTGC